MTPRAQKKANAKASDRFKDQYRDAAWVALGFPDLPTAMESICAVILYNARKAGHVGANTHTLGKGTMTGAARYRAAIRALRKVGLLEPIHGGYRALPPTDDDVTLLADAAEAIPAIMAASQ